MTLDQNLNYAVLSQTFDGGSAGQVYFLAVEVDLPGLINQGSCSVRFGIENQDLLMYEYDMSAQHGSVNASGILEGKPSHLDLEVTCVDYSGNSLYTQASFTNVQLSVYDPSVGTNPIQPVASEGLKNNDFENRSLFPWTTYTEPATRGRMTFDALDRRALVTFSGIVAGSPTPAYIDQLLDKPAEVGQHVRVRAEVHIDIPTAGTGTTCTVQILTGQPVAWTVENVGSSKTYHVDVWQTLTSTATQFSLFSSCTGTLTTTSVSFDNVYYTVNAVEPGPSVGTEELLNNEFEDGTLAPWYTDVDESGSVDISVISRKAVMTYTGIITATARPSAALYQPLAKALQVGQNVRVRADVHIDIRDATKCDVQILLPERVFDVRDVSSSESYHVDTTITLSQGWPYFYLFSTCAGTGTTTSVSFDNLYLTLIAP